MKKEYWRSKVLEPTLNMAYFKLDHSQLLAYKRLRGDNKDEIIQ